MIALGNTDCRCEVSVRLQTSDYVDVPLHQHRNIAQHAVFSKIVSRVTIEKSSYNSSKQ